MPASFPIPVYDGKEMRRGEVERKKQVTSEKKIKTYCSFHEFEKKKKISEKNREKKSKMNEASTPFARSNNATIADRTNN